MFIFLIYFLWNSPILVELIEFLVMIVFLMFQKNVTLIHLLLYD